MKIGHVWSIIIGRDGCNGGKTAEKKEKDEVRNICRHRSLQEENKIIDRRVNLESSCFGFAFVCLLSSLARVMLHNYCGRNMVRYINMQYSPLSTDHCFFLLCRRSKIILCVLKKWCAFVKQPERIFSKFRIPIYGVCQKSELSILNFFNPSKLQYFLSVFSATNSSITSTTTCYGLN